jgi:general secretion pathway protein A
MPLKITAVLIIDEAQHLSPAVLEELRVLSNLETDESKLLQIVLVGQLNLLDVLAAADMRQLEQRISLRATLQPLSRPEMETYISHRLSVARGSWTVKFDDEALDRIHAVSGGVPRVVNLLCDRALMLGAEASASIITREFVRQAAATLAIRPPGATRRRRIRWAAALAVAVVVLALAVFVSVRMM